MNINKNTPLIDIPSEYILNIEASPIEDFEYDEKSDSTILPKDKIVMYYWDKGYEPDIYYKMNVDIDGSSIEAIGDVITPDTNMVKYIEDMRMEIINDIIEYKFEAIGDKYKFLLKDIANEKGMEDYFEYDKIEALNIYNTIPNKNFTTISFEDKQFIDFYTKRINEQEKVEG